MAITSAALATAATYASIAASVASAGVAAYSSFKQGQASKAEANASARVSQRNAYQQVTDNSYNKQALESNKHEVLYQADVRRQNILKKGKYDKGSLTAKLASRGLSLDSASGSSALDALSLSYEEEASSVIYEGASQGLGYSRQQSVLSAASSNATNIGNYEASSYRAAGKNAYRSGVLGSIGSGLSGLSKAGDTYSSAVANGIIK